jgi:hypothetical protein
MSTAQARRTITHMEHPVPTPLAILKGRTRVLTLGDRQRVSLCHLDSWRSGVYRQGAGLNSAAITVLARIDFGSWHCALNSKATFRVADCGHSTAHEELCKRGALEADSDANRILVRRACALGKMHREIATSFQSLRLPSARQCARCRRFDGWTALPKRLRCGH